ncbi:MAG: hypothetical protein FVQ84_19640 [Planctomycetes bacterium]|nr:hypothetical protein [Planctomycetota bacterium]
MNNRELGSFAIKLLGVYALIQSLPLVQHLSILFGMRVIGEDDAPRRMIIYACQALPFSLILFLSIILMTCSRGIARILFREDIEINLGESGSWRELQSICFSCVAVLIFLQAMPRIGQAIINLWYLQTQQDMRRGYLISQMWHHGISAVIQCVLAVVLFFGSRGLANVWHRIQIGRYERIDED